MVNIKHDLVDLTFARMQNYAEMQYEVIVNLTKWYFLSIIIKYCIFLFLFITAVVGMCASTSTKSPYQRY